MEWPDPVPLTLSMPPVIPFHEDRLLPDSLRAIAVDIAERMQVPLDFTGVIGMITMAGAVNRRVQIQPKHRDQDWIVTPNLWGGIVADPGYLKSPVIKAMTQPLEAVEAEWSKDNQRRQQQYTAQLARWELKNTARKEQLKKDASGKADAPLGLPEQPPKPAARRIIVNDATPEALHEIMRDNPGGVLVVRDEITGWLADLDKKGREGERGLHLTAWNGDSHYTVDRIGRGTISVPACCESIVGGIQPDILTQYLGSRVGRIQDDGLIQRFQLLVRPDTSGEWHYVDRARCQEAATTYKRIVTTLANLDPINTVRFVFSPEAQEHFQGWLEDQQREIRAKQMPPILAAHLSKYSSLMPSIALLCELADRVTESSGGFAGFGAHRQNPNRVSIVNAERAVEWCEYLKSHANRIYSAVTPELNQAKFLAEKIRERKIGKDGSFTARDVYQHDWTGLKTFEAVEVAAGPLIQANWLRIDFRQSGPRGGRPSAVYLVNPKLDHFWSRPDPSF
jgi:hypothetical protein